MKKNTSHVLQHMLWRGLYFFSVLVINIGIARLFGAERSGQIFILVNNLAIVLLVVSLSLEAGATFFIASGKINASEMANFLILWTVIVSLLAIAGWGYIVGFPTSVRSDSSHILGGFFFLSGVLLTTYFTSLFYSKKEFALPNKILFIVNMILIISLFSMKYFRIVQIYFIELYFVSFFTQGLVLVLVFYNKNLGFSIFKYPSRFVLKTIIRYSLFALVANLAYFLVNRIDYWFVKYYCSPDGLGNYIQASKIAQMMLIVPSILGSTLFPIFSYGYKSENQPQLTAVIRVLVFINAGICLLILATGWYLIPLIFGHSFDQMYLLFVFLIPGILCVTINYPMAAWFSSSNRIGINLKGALLALVFICLGDLIALPHYGVIMASIVSSAGYFIITVYTYYIFQKENALPWKDFLIVRKSDLLKILTAIRIKSNNLSSEEATIQNSTL